MMLTTSDRKRLEAAEGFLALGMPMDANEELESIAPEARHLSEVLEVRLGIFENLERWELVQTVAATLAGRDAHNLRAWLAWTTAERRQGRQDEARRVLSAGITANSGRSGELWIALACLECDAGNLDRAKDALHKAIDTDGNLRLRALQDPALAPLWTV